IYLLVVAAVDLSAKCQQQQSGRDALPASLSLTLSLYIFLSSLYALCKLIIVLIEGARRFLTVGITGGHNCNSSNNKE
ncbi:hypothetical protein L9F63_006640, partial [Diploptera punctata]